MKKIIVIIGVVILVLGLGVLAVGLGGRGETAGAKMEKPTGGATAYATAYCPKDTALEGGVNDRRGKPLETLQQFVAGEKKYVSVAMDIALKDQGYPYGTSIRIPELETKYNSGKPIDFRLVDTGGSFTGTSKHPKDNKKEPRGLTAIDVAVSCDYLDSGAWQNGDVTLVIDATNTTLPD